MAEKDESWKELYTPVLMPIYLKNRGCRVPVGVFVREYLRIRDEDYVESIYKALKKEMLYYNCGRKIPSYESFRNYMNLLRRLGLVVFTREEEVPDRTFLQRRRYYRVNPEMYEMDELWENPFRYVREDTPIRFPTLLERERSRKKRPRRKPQR